MHSFGKHNPYAAAEGDFMGEFLESHNDVIKYLIQKLLMLMVCVHDLKYNNSGLNPTLTMSRI